MSFGSMVDVDNTTRSENESFTMVASTLSR